MMKSKKYTLHLVFASLILLTVGTAVAGYSYNASQLSRAGLLLGISIMKIILIGWWFMELHHAHRAWKVLFILIILTIAGALLLAL